MSSEELISFTLIWNRERQEYDIIVKIYNPNYAVLQEEVIEMIFNNLGNIDLLRQLEKEKKEAEITDLEKLENKLINL